MALFDELKAEAAALKAQVDAMQTKQTEVERRLQELIDRPQMPLSAEDAAELQSVIDMLKAETADVAADNADSPVADA